jgi:tRNA A37 methylthiotransferase MiaB
MSSHADRAGVFKYENVEGAPSRDLTGHVDQDDVNERYDRVMEVRTTLAHARGQAMIGRCVDAHLRRLGRQHRSLRLPHQSRRARN